MTRRRPWPNSSKHARDQAAERLQSIIRLAEPMLDHNDGEVVRRSGKILNHAQNAVRHLEQVDAQTRPDDL